VELTADAEITATSEDNYAADLSGAEALEAGKVYVALTDNGEQIEGIEGGQGGQLIVFGDPNSKRAVRYLKTIEVK
jgi:phage gp36-like protein